MIRKYLVYIGLLKKESSTNQSQTPIQNNYVPSSIIKVAERYLSYLKEISNYQKDRRTTIENKNSQLVGQASIVTSIFALFVPLLINSFSGINLWVKIIISFVFILVLFHYSLSLYFAFKTLKIKNYRYPTRSTTTLTKSNRANSELKFINTEIEDLIYIINHTTPLDNQKGENLIYGARSFELANFGFGIMTILIILSTFVMKKEVQELKINNLKEINLSIPDTFNTKLIDFKTIDSLTIKIDSLENKIKIENKN